jgi:hypothetical protein
VTHDFLCSVAEEQDSLPNANVACFGMLPFPLAVRTGESFSTPAGRDGATATFHFEHFRATVDPTNLVAYQPYIYGPNSEYGVGTRVFCFITLWGRHLFYYPHYLSCLGDNGLELRSLNKSLWGKKRAPVGYDGEAMSSHRYEDELNRAIVLAFASSFNIFLDNYNVIALQSLSAPKTIPGVFTMLAPGRVSFRRQPVSPASLMFEQRTLIEQVDSSALIAALKFGRRQFDRYQHQLLSMQSLARHGEPELAVIGSVTAIEWFLNTIIVPASIPSRWVGKQHTFSIREVFEIPLALKVNLSSELIARLRSAGKERNGIVHGKPPQRLGTSARSLESQVEEIVRAGFALYKEAQIQLRIGLVN